MTPRVPPADVTIPEGWSYTNTGRCRSCGEPMVWCLTPAYQRVPLNRDGTSHFSTCPDAAKWRRRTP